MAAMVERLSEASTWASRSKRAMRRGAAPLHRASEPKRMWVVDAGGDQAISDEGEVGWGLLEAMDWVACASSH